MTVKKCQREECPNKVQSTDYRTKYCSKSCAAQVNNVLFPKRQKNAKPLNVCTDCGRPVGVKSRQCLPCYLKVAKPPKLLKDPSQSKRSYEEKDCLNCNKVFTPKQGIEYCCSRQCSSTYSSQLKYETRIKQWLEGSWRGGSDLDLSNTVRKYLLQQSEYTCSKCGFNTFHPDDGKTVLEINHIDGDGTNHKPSNLEVLCPNCHALTSSYRARNIGKGRPVYYLRVSS